jgi:MFS family permease
MASPAQDPQRVESARRIAILLVTRGLRGFIDGMVSIVLARYLSALGFNGVQVGAIVTATLVGSAIFTIGVGIAGRAIETRRLLLLACVLMFATGLGFAGFSSLWPLVIVAFVGTLNPSNGDVSVFLPVEQAALAVAGRDSVHRTSLFARYNVVGTFAGALGALCAGAPGALAARLGGSSAIGDRVVFVAYAAVALVSAGLYARLEPSRASSRAAAATRSRNTILKLAALFSVDSFGGGFALQSLLVLWLYRRFHLSVQVAGSIFFAAGLAGALSQFLSPRVARRLGLVRTMVYTHLPANLFLIAAGLMPSVELSIAFLLLRAALSQMDVPARQSLVMTLVPAEERAAAASITNVPRSLAAAFPPLLTGLMLDRSTFGWPLICAGTLKAVYDLLLLATRPEPTAGESHA